MSPTFIAAIAYGALTLLGGVIGYATAKSKPSLISGLVVGLLLIVSGVLYWQGYPWARIAAMFLTFLLFDVFVWRLVKTRKLMPAGLMIGASIVAFAAMLQG